jgi:hypothetical protein
MRKSLLVACLALAPACSSGSEENDGSASSSKPMTSTKPTASTATPPASASVKIDKGETKPGIVARVKAEVDNRTDGLTGTLVAVSGAKVSLQSAKDWTTAKGEVTVVSSADKKAGLGAVAGTAEKLEAVATAMGLRECQWNASESITIGKDKLPGSGADGLCKKGDQEVKAAMVVVSGEDLLVVGAWEAGGDDASIFGSMRSIARGGGQTSNVAACCRALEQNAVSAPPDKKGGYLLAIGACKAALANKDTAAAIRSIQSAAKGIGLPAECK